MCRTAVGAATCHHVPSPEPQAKHSGRPARLLPAVVETHRCTRTRSRGLKALRARQGPHGQRASAHGARSKRAPCGPTFTVRPRSAAARLKLSPRRLSPVGLLASHSGLQNTGRFEANWKGCPSIRRYTGVESAPAQACDTIVTPAHPGDGLRGGETAPGSLRGSRGAPIASPAGGHEHIGHDRTQRADRSARVPHRLNGLPPARSNRRCAKVPGRRAKCSRCSGTTRSPHSGRRSAGDSHSPPH